MTVSQAASPRTPGRAVVIGGGIAGLATSALLAADGWSVSVLEARDDLGGRAGSWEPEGFRFDTGPFSKSFARPNKYQLAGNSGNALAGGAVSKAPRAETSKVCLRVFITEMPLTKRT